MVTNRRCLGIANGDDSFVKTSVIKRAAHHRTLVQDYWPQQNVAKYVVLGDCSSPAP